MKNNENQTKRVGIIGCGNVASALHECLEGVKVVAVFDRHIDRARRVAGTFGAEATDQFDHFLSFAFDLVIETASVEAVRHYGIFVLHRGADLVVLSSGALADAELKTGLEAAARKHAARLHVPSGAIFGLDNAHIGRLGALNAVRMRTVKPPHSLHVDVTEKTRLFSGGAFECIRRYPKNANAAVSLSLAAGVEAQVEVWADPAAEHIRHELHMEGAFGSVNIAIDNRISKQNPSTSYLAVLSICALLRSRDESVTVGA